MTLPLHDAIQALPETTRDEVMEEIVGDRERAKAMKQASGMASMFSLFFGEGFLLSALAYSQTDEGRAELEKHGIKATLQPLGSRDKEER